MTMGDDSTKEPWCTRKKCCQWTVDQMKKRIPVIVWLPEYKWRDLYPDALAGVTLMFINVPQGLAFSVLANVDLMFGLYTSCFSAFLYTFLGTATFSSFGATAIGSLLTGDVVDRVVQSVDYTTSDIAVVITFLIGIWYLIGFILRLGVITFLFRKPFVCGFITACSLHIISRTLKMLFGLRTKSKSGLLAIFYDFYAVVDSHHLFNYPTIIMSSIILLLLILNLTVFRHILAKYTKFVLPVEAIVMTLAIIVSYYSKFESMGVPVVGEVSGRCPIPKLPEMSLIVKIWDLSILVAFVNYSTTSSMVLLFNEDIDADQELLAMAVVNLVCCNIQCLTVGNSMMRTVVTMNLGVRSLLATTISSLLLLFVILFGGSLFQPLPMCVLGCIIIVSTGQLLIQRLKEVKLIWKSSLENGFIWGAVLLAGVIVSIELSMMIGVLLTLKQIMWEAVERDKLDKEKLQAVQTDEVMEARQEPPKIETKTGILSNFLNKDRKKNVKAV